MGKDIYKEFWELQKRHEECQKAIRKSLGYIYCVGGPLNDNVKGYTKDQLVTFWHISQTLDNVKEDI